MKLLDKLDFVWKADTLGARSFTTDVRGPIDPYPNEEVDQEEEATPREIPSGWTRVKLEPDC
jgi:hypothetical protein